MTDFPERLEAELKRRYELCDATATPDGVLLAILNAVAAARMTPSRAAEVLGCDLTPQASMSEPHMNEGVMDVCDRCLGDGEFVDYDGDSVPCSICEGTGYVMRDADECDMDYIADCGDPFAARS